MKSGWEEGPQLKAAWFVPSLTAYKMIKKIEKNEKKREREIVKIFDRSFRNPLQWNIERPASKLHSNIYCSDTEYPHICQSRCPSKCPTSQTVKVKKKLFKLHSILMNHNFFKNHFFVQTAFSIFVVFITKLQQISASQILEICFMSKEILYQLSTF